MGNSRTGRHAAGMHLHHPDAAWPRPVRAAWPQVRERVATQAAQPGAWRRMRRMPPRRHHSEVGPPRSVGAALRDPQVLRAAGQLARRWRVDPAEAAVLLAASPVSPRSANALAQARLALWLDATQLVLRAWPSPRPSTASRLLVRANALRAVARVPTRDLPAPEAAAEWATGPAGRRFLHDLLSFGAVPDAHRPKQGIHPSGAARGRAIPPPSGISTRYTLKGGTKQDL